MATKDTDIPGDIRVVKEFGKYHLGQRYTPERMAFLEEEAATGSIQTSTIIENGLAYLSNHMAKDADDGRDFDDGSDAKKSSIRNESTSAYRTDVNNIKNKDGGLRIVTDTTGIPNCLVPFVYTAMPHAAYEHLQVADSLKFAIDTDGKVTGKYAKWQVASFKELANVKFTRDSTELSSGVKTVYTDPRVEDQSTKLQDRPIVQKPGNFIRSANFNYDLFQF